MRSTGEELFLGKGDNVESLDLKLQEQILVVVSFAVVLTIDDWSLNALYSDLQLSLPLPILHDVTIPVTGAADEADHSNFEAFGLFLSTPESVPEEYELHS
jgi:hypothetical protein